MPALKKSYNNRRQWLYLGESVIKIRKKKSHSYLNTTQFQLYIKRVPNI